MGGGIISQQQSANGFSGDIGQTAGLLAEVNLAASC